jgi:uncharacterized repeat protein (TIGR01451 family)
MSRQRTIWVVVGVLAAAVGLVFVFVPRLAGGLTTSQTLITLLGLLALLQGVRAVNSRRGEKRRETDPPDPEIRAGVETPDDDFDRALATRSPTVRDRLETAAHAVMTHHDDLSETEARDRLDRGTWTDDTLAAAFFSPEIDPRGGFESGSIQRPEWLGGEPGVVGQARHVIWALARRFDLDPGSTSAAETDEDRRRTLPPRERPTDTDDPAYIPVLAETIDRQTKRWMGVSAFALLAGAVGILVREPGLLLVAVIGIALTAYAAFGRAGTPSPVDLVLERTVSEERPAPGDDVEVTVTVRNAGDTTLSDLRMLDGVPPALTVVDGTVRRGMGLRPGEEHTFSYTLAAEYGTHTFQPALVIARDVTGERERVRRIEADEETPLSCHPPSGTERADDLELRTQTTPHVGRITTDIGGSGVEFHATREYQPGDPLSLIDWNRLARTGQLATLEFREERAAAVMLAIDARTEAYLASSVAERSAVARSVEAADAAFEALLDQDNRVGLTALSPEPCWLAPGGGSAHRARGRQLLMDHPALSKSPPEGVFLGSIQVAHLRRRLPSDAQVVLFSPLCDEYSVEVAKTLDAGSHRVTVISPDPTTETTVGRQLARIERLARIAALRRVGIPVHDWAAGDALALTLAQAERVHA